MPQKTPTKPKWRHEDVTAPAVDDYLYSMLPPRDEVLAEMEDYATKHTVPIVGPAVARVLQQLAMMIKAKPSRYFLPPYVGPSGWVGVRLDGRVNWTELADLLEDAYDMTAAKRKSSARKR